MRPLCEVKQILQNLGSGETLLAKVPAPLARAGHLLIRTEAPVVSLGTEKTLVDFGQANLLEKARQQAEKAKHVLQMHRTDGLFTTVGGVRAKFLENTREQIAGMRSLSQMLSVYTSSSCVFLIRADGWALDTLFIRLLFGIPLNDTTSAFKAYRRTLIQGCEPLISPHFNLTVGIPLKAIVRGCSWTDVPIS